MQRRSSTQLGQRSPRDTQCRQNHPQCRSIDGARQHKMHICDPQLNDARLRRRDRFWRWVRRDLNNRHECWLGPCPSIGHFAVVACYRGVHLPPPREQQAAVDPILPRHLGDIGSLRETLGQDPSLLLRRPAPPAPATTDQFDPAVALPIMLVLMPIMKQRTIPLFKKQGAQSTVRRTSARWGPHAAIDRPVKPAQALVRVSDLALQRDQP